MSAVCAGLRDTAASAGPSDSRGKNPMPGPVLRSAPTSAAMTRNGSSQMRACTPGPRRARYARDPGDLETSGTQVRAPLVSSV